MSSIFLALALCAANALAFPVAEQQPLGLKPEISNPNSVAQSSQGLTGRFLHITDFHPDPYYLTGASSDGDDACHRGHGSIGYYGAEGSDCDSPVSLVNETFRWIENNLKGKVDFVVWTGDSARHDNDDDLPRSEAEVIQLNEMIAGQFIDAFKGEKSGPSIPIIPTFGNNDIMPHNIMKGAPNKWTKKFLGIWKYFIPETQRHTFVEGGWFTSEVIPGKLAVISLNTMYFFDSNSAVDGCSDKSEPGYEHMEWLRIQLQMLRQRNMKAILMGHVPPARSSEKQLWDESCWQKYALWKHQYRDVIAGSVYGHMNMDHFFFQDSDQVTIADFGQSHALSDATSGEITISSKMDYLDSLRDEWSQMPSPPWAKNSVDDMDDWFEDDSKVDDNVDLDARLSMKKKRRDFLKKIGGPWAERYSVALAPPSLVPNFFPTLRVIEYNISGIEDTPTWAPQDSLFDGSYADVDENEEQFINFGYSVDQQGKKKKKKKPKFKVPEPPSSTAPPGPAYSNQPLTFLGYTQYFANLTRINKEVEDSLASGFDPAKDRDIFSFEVEYETNDDIYKMKDLTVRSYFKLATKMALDDLGAADVSDNDLEASKKKKKKKKENIVWQTFLDRAFVGLLDADDDDD